jgi:hypothetical protein
MAASGVVQADDGSVSAGKVQLQPGSQPGELTIDATGSNVMLTPLNSTLSTADLANYAQKNLNAQLILDPGGNIIGVRGTVTVLGQPQIVNATTHQITGSTDPVADLLGLTPSVQSAITPYAIPRTVDSCDTTGYNCYHAESWQKHYDLKIFDYNDIGASTSQTKGGYYTETHFCWLWGFIPWGCTSSHGSNYLTVGVGFYAYPKDGNGNPITTAPPVLVESTSKAGQDTGNLEFRQYSVTWFSSVSSLEKDVVGVCGYHSMAAGGSSQSAATKDGYVDGYNCSSRVGSPIE